MRIHEWSPKGKSFDLLTNSPNYLLHFDFLGYFSSIIGFLNVLARKNVRWKIRRLILFCPCYWHTLRLGRLSIRLSSQHGKFSKSYLKKKHRKNSDSLMGIERMTPDLTLSQAFLDYGSSGIDQGAREKIATRHTRWHAGEETKSPSSRVLLTLTHALAWAAWSWKHCLAG